MVGKQVMCSNQGDAHVKKYFKKIWKSFKLTFGNGNVKDRDFSRVCVWFMCPQFMRNICVCV